MSLFKARDWWATYAGSDEEFDQGCLCVANIDNNSSHFGRLSDDFVQFIDWWTEEYYCSIKNSICCKSWLEVNLNPLCFPSFFVLAVCSKAMLCFFLHHNFLIIVLERKSSCRKWMTTSCTVCKRRLAVKHAVTLFFFLLHPENVLHFEGKTAFFFYR